jgi:hypothetical protein
MEKALCALTGGEGGQCSAVNLGGQVCRGSRACRAPLPTTSEACHSRKFVSVVDSYIDNIR